MEFIEFDKIARLNREVIVTEKIDGTNGQVNIRQAVGSELEFGYDTQIEVDGVACYIRAGSRNRWVMNAGKDDNSGFGRWVHAHAHELAALGVGAHFGEWWGQGIQRNYGLTEKRFSLFNVVRWADPIARPLCCEVVPTLASGVGYGSFIGTAMERLRTMGSAAAPGFMNPEGIIVYHVKSRFLLKATLEKDDEYKGKSQ